VGKEERARVEGGMDFTPARQDVGSGDIFISSLQVWRHETKKISAMLFRI
jgi:hypothetical protein